jgi:SAM-dependent methyltransferase
VLDEDRLAERAVAVSTGRTWLETARAFDAVADEYHDSNTANPILQHMRDRAVATLRRHVPAGATVLDLGCGPGTDHPAMLAAGYRVTAIDISPEMVRRAQRRADAAGGPHRPTILCRSIDDLDTFPSASFDAAFSNLGPLNCVDDLARAARLIHGVVRPGGVVVVSVIGRVCPWEIALHCARGDFNRAFLRFRESATPVPLKNGTVWTTYYSPASFEETFAVAGFTRTELFALGAVAPPPYVEAFAKRHPLFVGRLQQLDDVVGRWPGVRSLGDHFVMVLRR